MSVHADGDGTVVDQRHLHLSAKFTGSNRVAKLTRHGSAETIVERNGDIVLCSPDIRRAITLLVRSHESKLTYNNNVAAHIKHRAIHYAVGIIKNTQQRYLLDKPLNILLAIRLLDAKEHQESDTYARFDCSVNRYARFFHPLNDNSH